MVSRNGALPALQLNGHYLQTYMRSLVMLIIQRYPTTVEYFHQAISEQVVIENTRTLGHTSFSWHTAVRKVLGPSLTKTIHAIILPNPTRPGVMMSHPSQTRLQPFESFSLLTGIVILIFAKATVWKASVSVPMTGLARTVSLPMCAQN